MQKDIEVDVEETILMGVRNLKAFVKTIEAKTREDQQKKVQLLFKLEFYLTELF